MKYVVDAQLPPALATELIRLGQEAKHVAELGLRDASDRVVWSRSLQMGAAILTKDEDFAARRVREPRGPTIIWIRIGNCSRAALLRRVLPLIGQIQRLVAEGETLIEIR